MEPSITGIEKGDQGGPAIYALGNNQKGRKYLSGIATFDLKNGLPPKYVRIIHFVNWILRDHSNKALMKPRFEVNECLVRPYPDPWKVPKNKGVSITKRKIRNPDEIYVDDKKKSRIE